MHYKLNRVDNAHACIERQAQTIRHKNAIIATKNAHLEAQDETIRKWHDMFKEEMKKRVKLSIKAGKLLHRLACEKEDLTQLVNKLSTDNATLIRRLESVEADLENHKRDLAVFHSEKRRAQMYQQAINRRDVGFDSRPREVE